ncbi:hypothetical protein CHGG_09709 [Chaetomium globosum CBS 148.51]|uniref:Haloacid dehalogenase n=1 Tax=Chaetomium globosum (strain ATCC 6205 / CBS 148.51 / DSM 1962 / NBRC 6347 / NRRL 1970) TaxID=306901 RepID=Q2GQP5_CHAGB|nr:uncharacterized protein CHGG_09709 [Chaetomium globosum CBS 148.51]EAQ83305.1 hypothetical protein CHGG_09709 [Chaetomium globosum CBS 148.51]
MTVIAFDLYGTLLSTESIAEELAKIVGDEHSTTLAALWRRYQLEYTWRSNSMAGDYQPFETLTRASLLHAAAELSLALTPSETDHLLEAYHALPVYPDVPAAFEAIRTFQTTTTTPTTTPTQTNSPHPHPLTTYLFTNSSRHTLTTTLRTSPSLARYTTAFHDVISVEDVRVYKPAGRAYAYLLERAGHPEGGEGEGEVWLVSSNAF